MGKSYVKYHVHSDLSLLDSCTQFEDYVDKAVASGDKAIASTEHGIPRGWVSKKLYCDKMGIKFIHGVEIYLTESLEPKVRDNYHTILLAKNMDGVRELNRLIQLSSKDDHFYYVNRLSFDEFLGISENILTTSACLASPLNKLPPEHPRYLELARKYDYLEIQPHIDSDQVAFNQRLWKLSKELGKPLIAGTDTHSLNQYKAECRAILAKAKHKKYDDDSFDLTWKEYDELEEAFRRQNALPEEVWRTAIEETNRMADRCENFSLDTSIKYPILYGSPEEDERVYQNLCWDMLDDKLKNGVIPKEQEAAFRSAIQEELQVFQKLGMSGFMLGMSELVRWCKDQGMAIGTARGSVGGSRCAYVTDTIDLNPEQWGTIFSRFANANRVEPGDVDTDVVESDRPAIFKYIVDRFGEDYTARVASYGTLVDKSVIEEIGRGLREENPEWYSVQNVDRVKKLFVSDPDAAKKAYPDIFYYFDGLVGTRVSQSVHPAGMIISPVSLPDNYCVFLKDGEWCLTLDMDEAHEAGLIKYDLLVLKTVQVIRDACRYIGTHYPKTYEVDWDDQAVWESIRKDTTTIFQFEGSFASDCLKKFKTNSILDMSLVTASIRPGGASYRDDLLARKVHKNPSPLIDELLKDNLGYLVYQEDTTKFLQQICGFSPSDADSIRRGIAKKRKDILDEAMPKILDGYCAKSDHPREIAEREAKEFLQVIEDSARYQFNYSHSVAYCLLGYLCGYYRYYYPLEYLTAFLNDAANDDDIQNGTAYANKIGIRVTPPKFGHSRSNYSFDKESRTIAKGLSSIKYMSEKASEELYQLSKETEYDHFMDLLWDITRKTSLDTRQLDLLIKIDFFSCFGNQRELMRMSDLYYKTFNKGELKKFRKESADAVLADILPGYSTDVTKSGAPSKTFTITDMRGLLRELEDRIHAAGLKDLGLLLKAQNFKDIMGYAGYITGKEEDRRKLLVMEVFPLLRNKDRRQFGYSIITKSIGSGVEARFTVLNAAYQRDPIRENDIIFCRSFIREGQYFKLTGWNHLNPITGT